MRVGSAGAAALDGVFSAAYEELRRLATNVRRDSPNATLSPTALVHEAWLKLSRSPDVARLSHLHFKRVAARAMRQVLIEAARRRQAEKRGAAAVLVTFDEALDAFEQTAEQVLALHDALDALAVLSPRQAAIVEARFFGGFEVRDIAAVLDISEATVLRDWRLARAWLSRELKDPHG